MKLRRFRALRDFKPVDKDYPWMVVSNHTAKVWAIASDRRRAGEIVRALNGTPSEQAERATKRIRKMAVSMRIHALGKKSIASKRGRPTGEVAFYDGQEDAMAQLLKAMEPNQKKARK